MSVTIRNYIGGHVDESQHITVSKGNTGHGIEIIDIHTVITKTNNRGREVVTETRIRLSGVQVKQLSDYLSSNS